MIDTIYFDNNASTFASERTIKFMLGYTNLGNPSSNHKGGKKATELISSFKEKIAELCNISQKDYKIIITSGATESNSLFLQSLNNFRDANDTQPYTIVTSNVEHKSIYETINYLKYNGKINHISLNVKSDGICHPDDLYLILKNNKVDLVCIMYVNNETGSKNDIELLGKICHNFGVPFFVDAVQGFGKYCIYPDTQNVDIFTASLHKLYGISGTGILCVKKTVIKRFNICAFLCGSQNEGYRGGTENILGIAAGYAALDENFTNREEKNAKLLKLKTKLKQKLNERIDVIDYEDYLKRKDKIYEHPMLEIIWLSPNESSENTALISFIDYKRPKRCNLYVLEKLREKNIIISEGSACNTNKTTKSDTKDINMNDFNIKKIEHKDKKHSHVLDAMGADDLIKNGTLRISFGDHNTIDEVDMFVGAFVDILKK
jgi:cysteine desulfurase